MIKKKGQSLALRIIIIAVLLLVVAGVLLYVFSDRIKIFKAKTESCVFQGGTCKASCSGDETEIAKTDCSGERAVCCVGVLG